MSSRANSAIQRGQVEKILLTREARAKGSGMQPSYARVRPRFTREQDVYFYALKQV
jgi:hypothetical protein